MDFSDALEMYKLLFSLGMVSGMVWMLSGYWNFKRRGISRWCYTLNRVSFVCMVGFLFLAVLGCMHLL